jgi:hypothetical protein
VRCELYEGIREFYKAADQFFKTFRCNGREDLRLLISRLAFIRSGVRVSQRRPVPRQQRPCQPRGPVPSGIGKHCATYRNYFVTASKAEHPVNRAIQPGRAPSPPYSAQ